MCVHACVSVHICACVYNTCTHVCAMVHVWRNLFYYVNSVDQTQVVRLSQEARTFIYAGPEIMFRGFSSFGMVLVLQNGLFPAKN